MKISPIFNSLLKEEKSPRFSFPLNQNEIAATNAEENFGVILFCLHTVRETIEFPNEKPIHQ